MWNLFFCFQCVWLTLPTSTPMFPKSARIFLGLSGILDSCSLPPWYSSLRVDFVCKRYVLFIQGLCGRLISCLIEKKIDKQMGVITAALLCWNKNGGCVLLSAQGAFTCQWLASQQLSARSIFWPASHLLTALITYMKLGLWDLLMFNTHKSICYYCND